MPRTDAMCFFFEGRWPRSAGTRAAVVTEETRRSRWRCRAVPLFPVAVAAVLPASCGRRPRGSGRGGAFRGAGPGFEAGAAAARPLVQFRHALGAAAPRAAGAARGRRGGAASLAVGVRRAARRHGGGCGERREGKRGEGRAGLGRAGLGRALGGARRNETETAPGRGAERRERRPRGGFCVLSGAVRCAARGTGVCCALKRRAAVTEGRKQGCPRELVCGTPSGKRRG